MVICEVNGCENSTTHKSQEQLERERNGFKIHFYRFPRSEERRKLWLQLLERENWTPDDKSVICSDHFTPECFEHSDVSSFISKHAIPSIFPADNRTEVNTFEFIPISNPNEILRINKETLDIEDPLNVQQIKLESESMEIEPIVLKEEDTNENDPEETIVEIIPIEDSNSNYETCDTSAQTETVQMEEIISDTRVEQQEMEKTKTYKKKIKTLQQTIRRQDRLIENLEKKIAEIRGKTD